MSTDWTVYCRECDSVLDITDANHEVELMRELVKSGPTLRRIATLARSLPKRVELTLDADSGYGWPTALEWFGDHGGHDLVARDEYGREDGQCGERVTCVCGSRVACVLERGHEGEHAIAEHAVTKGAAP